MVTLKELNPKNHSLTEEQVTNILTLLERINIVREKWGKPMIVTSGFRSWDEHVAIYTKLGVIEGVNLDGTPKVKKHRKFPTKSAHLAAAAVDISDPDGMLWGWCKDNLKLFEEVGLWLEEKGLTPRVHFQIVEPPSKNRIFLP